MCWKRTILSRGWLWTLRPAIVVPVCRHTYSSWCSFTAALSHWFSPVATTACQPRFRERTRLPDWSLRVYKVICCVAHRRPENCCIYFSVFEQSWSMTAGKTPSVVFRFHYLEAQTPSCFKPTAHWSALGAAAAALCRDLLKLFRLRLTSLACYGLYIKYSSLSFCIQVPWV